MSYNWKLDAQNEVEHKKCLRCPFYDTEEVFEDGTFTLGCQHDVGRRPKGCPKRLGF